MKKLLLLELLAVGLIAQQNPAIPFNPPTYSGTGLPALCNNGSLFYNVSTYAWYSCGPVNNWVLLGSNAMLNVPDPLNWGSGLSIALAQLPGYWPAPIFDNVEGSLFTTGGTSGSPAIGQSFYTRNNSAGDGVAVFSVCQTLIPNGVCFGHNVGVGTEGYSGATNPTTIGMEIDLAPYYTPTSNSFGVSVVQYNVQNPSPAFIVRNGNGSVPIPAFNTAFNAETGCCLIALNAGAQKVGASINSNSEEIQFQSTDSGGNLHVGEMYQNITGEAIMNFVGFQNSSALKPMLVNSCTTAATAGATCNTTITWPSAFADTNYSTSCELIAFTGTPQFLNVQSKSASAISVQIGAFTNVAASGQLTCWGIHY